LDCQKGQQWSFWEVKSLSEAKLVPKDQNSIIIYYNEEKEFSLIIDASRCKGCGLCVATCPQLALDFSKNGNIAQRGNRVPTAYPERCVKCKKCEKICPDFAIFLLDR